jgi:hypothetical protein
MKVKVFGIGIIWVLLKFENKAKKMIFEKPKIFKYHLNIRD